MPPTPRRDHTPGRGTRRARWLAAPLVALALSAGCNSPDFEPRTLVHRMRVLAVRADPPYFDFFWPVDLQMKVVGLEPDTALCHAWALCLFIRKDEGNLACFDADLQVDLGTGATATLRAEQVLEALERLPAVLDKHGMGELDGGEERGRRPPGRCEQGERPSPLPELYVLFKVARRDAMGGSCPETAGAMLGEICGDRRGCVAGYKRLLIATKLVTRRVGGVCETLLVADPYKEHHNPVLEGLELDGIAWPADAMPTLAPVTGEGGGGGFGVGTGEDERGVELLPVLGEGSVEVSGRSLEAGIEDPTEKITYSWLSTAGTFTYGRSTLVAPDTRYLAAAPEQGGAQDVTLWLVARDGRGGVSWLERGAVVRSDAQTEAHPLCAGADPARRPEGCPP